MTIFNHVQPLRWNQHTSSEPTQPTRRPFHAAGARGETAARPRCTSQARSRRAFGGSRSRNSRPHLGGLGGRTTGTGPADRTGVKKNRTQNSAICKSNRERWSRFHPFRNVSERSIESIDKPMTSALRLVYFQHLHENLNVYRMAVQFGAKLVAAALVGLISSRDHLEWRPNVYQLPRSTSHS